MSGEGEKLSALDATFLELEQADEGATMHIGGVMVFDPVPNGGTPSLEAIRAKIADRLGDSAPLLAAAFGDPHGRAVVAVLER